MSSSIDTQRGDLQSVLGLLARRAWLIALGVVVCAGAAFGLSTLQERRYEASASLLFRALTLDAQLTGLPLQLQGDAARDAETNVRLVSAEPVRAAAAKRLGAGYTADGLADTVTVAGDGQSSIVAVTATSPDPETAARIANAVAVSYVTLRRAAIRRQIADAEAEVAAQADRAPAGSDRRSVLRDNEAKLALLRATAQADAQVSQPATPPEEPASPKPLRNALIGGFVGILVGLVLVLAAEGVDRRMTRPAELSDALGVPLLAVVPESDGLGKGRGWQSHLSVADVEPFKRLRANLRHVGGDGDLGSVLVTSATAEAGKTTVALHLAGAAAAAGSDVLLIEADMRRPQLARVLDVDAAAGLSTMLAGDGALRAEGVHRIRTTESLSDPRFNGNGKGDHVVVEFDVLVAGPPPANPSELLDSPRMREVLESAVEHYDFVVVDGPPPGIVSDALPLMKAVDGVLVVSRLGRERRDAVERLRDDMRRLDARPVGAVANFSRERKASPYYEYA